MARYRKKPVVIEGIQWNGKNHQEILDFTEGTNIFKPHDISCFVIPTLEGEMTASINDFIIKGVQGEFYPCKPDIFQKTYELVD